MSERVGFGVFGWSGTERRGDRYGAFFLGQKPYDGDERVAAHLDQTALKPLVGKRVRVTLKVVKARDSGHLGDLFHRIFPSRPDVGEVIDLGVGTLHLESAGFDNLTAVVLEPSDGRPTFWIDPHKFYRLHDQTVDLFIEETTDDFSRAPIIVAATDAESVDTGDGDFQVKGVKDNVPIRIPADIERLGDGLFAVRAPTGMEAGRRRKLEKT